MAKRTDHQIAIDDALTKDLCRYDEIYDYMAHCANELRRQFADNRDVFYYVKGSAALARYLRNAGLNEDRINRLCARSDWDTQLVINPLLPAKEWFTAFKAVEQTLIESLRRFEDGLLVVFAGFKDSGAGAPPEALADPGVPQAKNDLGKDLRADIGKDFGEVFLATSRHEHFDQPGHVAMKPDRTRRCTCFSCTWCITRYVPRLRTRSWPRRYGG